MATFSSFNVAVCASDMSKTAGGSSQQFSFGSQGLDCQLALAGSKTTAQRRQVDKSASNVSQTQAEKHFFSGSYSDTSPHLVCEQKISAISWLKVLQQRHSNSTLD